MDLATFVKVMQKISTKLKYLGKNQTNINLNTNCANINVKTQPSTHQPTTRFAAIFFTTVITTILLFFTAIGIHLGPIDISYADKQEPLSEKKKKCRNKLSLCRYCGQPGYMAKNHNNASTLQAKRYAASIHEMTMALPLENMPFSSTITLGDLLD